MLDARFRLERALGVGGAGVVWLAADTQDSDALVALKLLHGRLAQAPGAASQLQREAEVLASLGHPHIARCRGFYSGGVQAYLVMEYIDGLPLDRELGRRARGRTPFSLEEAAALLAGVSSAIRFAHARKIIHRDLKPQNLMVRPGMENLGVKVLDFGIAKLLESSWYEATTLGRRIGSVFYMSPEQTRGEPADARSDVFALSSVLFEVLTLRRAWAWDQTGTPLPAFVEAIREDGANAVGQVLQRIAAAPRVAPSQFRSDLPPALDAVLAKGMAVAPAERFPTVMALEAAVQAALAPSASTPAVGLTEAWSLPAPVAEAATAFAAPASESETSMRTAIGTSMPPSGASMPAAPPALAPTTSNRAGAERRRVEPGTGAVDSAPTRAVDLSASAPASAQGPGFVDGPSRPLPYSASSASDLAAASPRQTLAAVAMVLAAAVSVALAVLVAAGWL